MGYPTSNLDYGNGVNPDPAGDGIPDGLQAALDSQYAPLGSAGGGVAAGFAYQFMEALERDTGSLVLAVSGDSKSNGTDEWVHLLAQKLADRYPAFTVTIRHKTNGADTYEATATLQTGTGANTLAVYNWSQSGASSVVGYDSNALLEIAFPVAPDLFLIAGGANDDMTTGGVTRAKFVRDATRRVAAYYPNARFGVVLLNPHTDADTFVGAGGTVSGNVNLSRSSSGLVDIAADQGFGLLNLQTAWWDRVGGYDDLLADSKHPNADGSEFLAETALTQLVAAIAGPPTPSSRRRLVTEQVYIPLLGGVALSGSPVVAAQAAYGSVYGVAFDGTADEQWLCPPIELPEWWTSMTIEIDWCNQANGAGNVYWEVRFSPIGPGLTSGGALGGLALCATPASFVGKGITSTVTSAFTIPSSLKSNAKTNGPNYPLMTRVQRFASNAGDTINGVDALAYGVRLIRNT